MQVANLIDALADEELPEAAEAAAVKIGRGDLGRIEVAALVRQRQPARLRIDLHIENDRTLSFAGVGVPDEVGRGLLQSELELLERLPARSVAPGAAAALNGDAAQL